MSPVTDDVIVRLPDEHRAAFKDPLGPIYTDPEEVLEAINGPLITVGDVVSYHFERIGHVPDVAIVDGRTKRTAVDPEIEAVLAESTADRLHATNPAGTLTDSLIRAITIAIERTEPTQVVVDGEEDLATVPAVVLAPKGTAVVYGQPEEGMVLIGVTSQTRERAHSLLGRMEGDHARLESLLGG